MDTVVVNDEAFASMLGAHVASIRALRAITVPIPPERQEDVIERSAELFGETMFADMAIAAVGNRDPDAMDAYARFLEAVDSTVRAKGVIGWLFRMLWDADDSATKAVREGSEDDAASARDYLRDVCAMAATIMLHYVEDRGMATGLAALLLGDRYDDVLSLWLPQTDVLLDEASFQHMYEELERHRALKAFQESLPQVPLPPDSVDGEERPAYGVSGSGADGISGKGAAGAADGEEERRNPPHGPMELQYVFDADHVIAAYESFWRKANDGEADDVDPDIWSNRDFVYDQLVSLTGVSLVAEVLDTSLDNGDKAMFDQSLQLLEGYRRCVEANGLVTLPAYVVTTMCETLGFGDGEASFDKMRMVRHACFDMTEVMLTRIPDTDLRYDLAVALMSLDLDGYFDRAGGQVRSMVDDAETT